MEWQPIETAPKDGTFMILSGYKYNNEWRAAIADVFVMNARWVAYGRWCGRYEEWTGSRVDELYPPTHWMPLPPPPVDA